MEWCCLMNLLNLRNFLYLGFTFFIIAFIKALTIFVINPLKMKKFYSDQGISVLGKFFVGLIPDFEADIHERNDIFYGRKKIIKENPSLRCFVMNVGSETNLHIIDPKLIKEFFSKENLYKRHEKSLSLFKDLTGLGLLVSDGSVWKHHRKVISQVFHYEYLKEITPLIHEITVQHLDELQNKQDLNKVKLLFEFQKIAAEVIGQIFYGSELSSYQYDGKPITQALCDIVKEIFDLFFGFNFLIFGPTLLRLGLTPTHRKIMKDIHGLRKVCLTIICERKKGIKRFDTGTGKKDMLDVLIEKQNEGGQNSISDSEIVDEFITFFNAGMDTTAHLVTMAVYHMNLNPHTRDELEYEVEKYYKSGATVDDLQKMEGMHRFLKETIRLSSPAKGIFFREALK